MKKIAIILLVILALTSVFTACNVEVEPTITKIAVVAPEEVYTVDSVIPYEYLQVEATYSDGSKITKTVKEWNATFIPADLSKEGDSSYTITIGDISTTVNITVEPYIVDAFRAPAFWEQYKTEMASTTENETSFYDKTQPYEVGNANKFLFEPVIEVSIGADYTPSKVDSGVQTIVEVFLWEDNQYTLLTDDALANYVTIEGNTYKFDDVSAVDQIFKIKVSLDVDKYLTGRGFSNTPVEAVVKVVANGYNVYDQHGLSVMNDSDADVNTEGWYNYSPWNEIWKAGTTTPLQLIADNKPLYQYVGKVDWLVLHGNIEIDAYNLPSEYFWLEGTEHLDTAKTKANEILIDDNGDAVGAKYLMGSLRDGAGNGESTRYSNINTDKATRVVPQNSQHKGVYQSYKVNISGNYATISIKDTWQKEGDRNLWTVINEGGENVPRPHWSLFKFVKAFKDTNVISTTGKRDETLTETSATVQIKNLKMIGNSPRSESNYKPSGLMMLTALMDEVALTNVVGEQFYTIFMQSCWSFGGTQYVPIAKVSLDKTKFSNVFSNMLYGHKGVFEVKDSSLTNAGGPLFLLVDGDRGVEDNQLTWSAPSLKVENSTLESFASGSEAWYVQYNAQALINSVKMMDGLLTNAGKTIIKENNGNECLNVIAAMIPDPNSLMTGDSSAIIQIQGDISYQPIGSEESYLYSMQNASVNPYLVTAQTTANYLYGAGQTSLALTLKSMPILQSGSCFMGTDGKQPLALELTGDPTNPLVTYAITNSSGTLDATGASKVQAMYADWAQNSTNTLAVYMNTVSQTKTYNAPYFGILLEMYSNTL